MNARFEKMADKLWVDICNKKGGFTELMAKALEEAYEQGKSEGRVVSRFCDCGACDDD